MTHPVIPTTTPPHLPLPRRHFNPNSPIYLLVAMASVCALIFFGKLIVSQVLSLRRRRRQQQQQREFRGPEPIDIVLPVIRRAGSRDQNRGSDTGAERNGVVDDDDEGEGEEEGSGGGGSGRSVGRERGDDAEGIHGDQADGRAMTPSRPLRAYQRRAEDRIHEVDMV